MSRFIAVLYGEKMNRCVPVTTKTVGCLSVAACLLISSCTSSREGGERPPDPKEANPTSYRECLMTALNHESSEAMGYIKHRLCEQLFPPPLYWFTDDTGTIPCSRFTITRDGFNGKPEADFIHIIRAEGRFHFTSKSLKENEKKKAKEQKKEYEIRTEVWLPGPEPSEVHNSLPGEIWHFQRAERRVMFFSRVDACGLYLTQAKRLKKNPPVENQEGNE